LCEVRSFTRTVCGCALTHVSAGTTLAEISQRLGLQRFIYVDHKAERNGWAHNAKLGEDVFEALIGAIYLDLGLVHAKRCVVQHTVRKCLLTSTNADSFWGCSNTWTLISSVTQTQRCATLSRTVGKRFHCVKTQDGLMQLMQKRRMELPTYPVLSHVEGVFTVGALVNGRIVGQGSGRTKKSAEQVPCLKRKKFAPRCLTLSTAQIAAYNALVNLGEDPQRCASVKNFLRRSCVSPRVLFSRRS